MKEYKSETIVSIPREASKIIEEKLNQLAKEGWRLIGYNVVQDVQYIMIFERDVNSKTQY